MKSGNCERTSMHLLSSMNFTVRAAEFSIFEKPTETKIFRTKTIIGNIQDNLDLWNTKPRTDTLISQTNFN